MTSAGMVIECPVNICSNQNIAGQPCADPWQKKAIKIADTNICWKHQT